MNEQLASSPAPGRAVVADDVVGRSFFPSRSWMIGFWVAMAMVALSLIGVGLTTTSRASAPTYWMCLVPVYGLLCITTAWFHTRHQPGGARPAVVRQVLHWLGIAAAVGLDFTLRGTGEETGQASGLTALLLLAVGCYLAGVHLEWLFGLVGVLLTFTLIIVVKAEQYMWVIFVVGAVLAAGLFYLRHLVLSAQRRKRTQTHPLPAKS